MVAVRTEFPIGTSALIEFASSVAVWSGGRRASKAWDAFEAANVGMARVIVVTKPS